MKSILLVENFMGIVAERRKQLDNWTQLDEIQATGWRVQNTGHFSQVRVQVTTIKINEQH